MHLLIPFASALPDAGAHILADLSLPNLSKLMPILVPTQRLGSDEYSLTPPHESALAAAWGWQGPEGALPFAARAAHADGIEVLDLAWGLLTPAHWHVGRDQITMGDPQALRLDEGESRAVFEAVRELFESEGFALAWGAPLRWYAAHESLAGLPCAALDRVIGRNVDLWLPSHPQARLVRRLQNEVQMLLYPHAITEDREARGELPVNSFWLSGCGRHQPADAGAVQVDETLRAPLLSEDWVGWAEAWRALDAGPIADLALRARRGEAVSLTLCGERFAQRFEPAPRTWWQRLTTAWSAASPAAMLEAL